MGKQWWDELQLLQKPRSGKGTIWGGEERRVHAQLNYGDKQGREENTFKTNVAAGALLKNDPGRKGPWGRETSKMTVQERKKSCRIL